MKISLLFFLPFTWLFFTLLDVENRILYAQTPPKNNALKNVPNVTRTNTVIIDSLTAVLTQKIDKASRYLVLKELCWLNRNLNRFKAIEYGNEALALAKASKNRRQEADILRFLGIVQWQHLYNQVALENYYKALKISEEIDYQEGIGFCYDNLVVAFTDQKKDAQALSYALKAVAVFEKIKHAQGLGYAYTHLGQLYFKTKNYDLALDIQQKALKIRQTQKDTTLINNSLREIAIIYKSQKQYELAKQYFQEALDLAKKVGNYFALAETAQHLAALYLDLHETDTALQIATESFEIAKKYHNFKQLVVNASILARGYEQKKDYLKAYNFVSLSQHYQDSLMNEEIKAKLVEKNMQYLFEKREHDFLIEQVKDEAKLRQQNVVIVMLAVFTVLASVMLYMIYKKKKQSDIANEDLQQKNEEIMQMAEELQAQTESLQTVNDFKDQLFSIIGHDLRSPLVGVNGIFELKQEGLLTDEEFLAVLPDVAQNIYQVTNLTENLLFWAKSQIKGQFLRLEVLDLHSFAKNQTDLFRTPTQNKNILLTNQVPLKTMVLADSNMLDLVLRNLVGNAVKFCKDCDIITITTTKIADEVQVCVADTGVGMTEENVQKLFGNFVFTLRGTSNEKGTGLGLRLCKEFVERNGGKIWVESEVGKGSKFYFTLKMAL